MKNNYPLAYSSWGAEEINAAQKVLLSGNCTMGNLVKKYEDNFSKKFNSKYSVMVNSGSSANLLAVASLFYSKKHILSKGDEVIVPAISWPTTYYPLYQYGLKLNFVDVDINTLNIDTKEIEGAITNKTRAIFAVNLLGNPCEYNTINKICKNNDIILLEDNCESLGGIYNKQLCGTFGLLSTTSSFFSHHICTVEGGVINTEDEELYKILLSLRAHGWTRDIVKPHNNIDSFYNKFNFILPGYNLRPNEIFAAIGLEQLKKVEKFIYMRRKNYIFFKDIQKRLDKYFGEDLLFQKETPKSKSSWLSFAMILNGTLKGKRNKIVDKLLQNNIDCRPIVAGNFIRNDVIKYLDYSVLGKLPIANLIHDNGLMIGNSCQDLSKEIEYFFKIMKGI